MIFDPNITVVDHCKNFGSNTTNMGFTRCAFCKSTRTDASSQSIPRTFAFVLILSVLASLLFPWGILLFSLVAGSYLTANLVASLMTASKKSWKYLSLMPICFLILHLSYGSGTLPACSNFEIVGGIRLGRIFHWYKSMPEIKDLHRLRNEYEDRARRLAGSDIYSWFNPANLFIQRTRTT